MNRYEVVPEEERVLFDRRLVDVVDYSKRRELKINQYKKEKELRGRIEVTISCWSLCHTAIDCRLPQKIRKERGQSPTSEDTDFDLISSLLPSPSSTKNEGEELDSDVDQVLRETILLLLRLLYTQSNTQMQSMKQELELLRNAPPSPIHSPPDDIEDPRDKQRKEDEEMWKLDIPVPGGPDGKGPLLDPTGKVSN
jgi:immunoglobulin-binding protein 1